ncbi:MAG: hypothetical protein WEA24_06155 [Gemmatimonadota bacterium]
MLRAITTLVLVLLTFGGLAAQEPARASDVVRIYHSVLKQLPDAYAERKPLVDPRVIQERFNADEPIRFVRAATLLESPESPVIVALLREIPGAEVCGGRSGRTSCLQSPSTIHVTFSNPRTTQEGYDVDVVFFGRNSLETKGTFVEAWRYSFGWQHGAIRMIGKEVLLMGHGRLR